MVTGASGATGSSRFSKLETPDSRSQSFLFCEAGASGIEAGASGIDAGASRFAKLEDPASRSRSFHLVKLEAPASKPEAPASMLEAPASVLEFLPFHLGQALPSSPSSSVLTAPGFQLTTTDIPEYKHPNTQTMLPHDPLPHAYTS